MKILATLISILVGAGCLAAQPNTTLSNSEFVFLTKEEGGAVLQTNDSFLQNLSPFDISARSKDRTITTRLEFGQFARRQALDWTQEEMTKTRAVLAGLTAKFSSKMTLFPAKIRMIKTTGREEAHAAYCRGLDAIVLPIDEMGRSPRSLEHTLAHELFHVVSRNNPALKEELYGLIGFRRASPLALPQAMTQLEITNPDAHERNHYFLAKLKSNETTAVVPVLQASAPYDFASGREFFEYLELHFLAVDVDSQGKMAVHGQDGKYATYRVEDIANYTEVVGQNTDYLIDPEEILADNFMLLILGPKTAVRSPGLLLAIGKVFGVEP